MTAPKLTPAMRAWLTKLRDEGPHEHRPILPILPSGSRTCFEHGLTQWGPGPTIVITPAGLAALEGEG